MTDIDDLQDDLEWCLKELDYLQVDLRNATTDHHAQSLAVRRKAEVRQRLNVVAEELQEL